jgi:hypothetical protein
LIDGKPLGSIVIDSGEIVDRAGRSIGNCRRSFGWRGFLRVLIPVGEAPTYPLILRDKQLAVITPIEAKRNGFGFSSLTAQLMVTEIDLERSEEEDDWLLALCVIEAGYHIPRSFSSAGG